MCLKKKKTHQIHNSESKRLILVRINVISSLELDRNCLFTVEPSSERNEAMKGNVDHNEQAVYSLVFFLQ